MTQENVKKDILNLAGELHPKLKVMLEEGGFRFVTETTESVSFILVSDGQTNWAELDQKYSVVKNEIKIVSLAVVSNKAEFWKYNGRAILDSHTLEDELLNKVVQRLFYTTSAVNVEYAYDTLLKKVFAFKLMNHLSIGNYLDVVANKAYEFDFDIVNLRAFYVNAISYFSYLEKAKIIHYPVEVQYGYSESSFVLQISSNSAPMYSEYLLQSFQNEDLKNPLKSLLSQCEAESDFLDVYELKNSGKLVLSGLWTKARNQKFTSVFTNNIPSFHNEKRSWAHKLPSVEYVPAEPTLESINTLQQKDLPGEGLKNLSPYFANRPEVLNQLLTHLNKKVIGDDSTTDLLTLENLEQHLSDFEDGEALKQLNEHDKGLLVSSWQNVKKNKMLGMDQALENLENWDFQEESDESASHVKGERAEKESAEIIRGTQQEKEGLTVIRGTKEKEDNKVTIVRGGSSDSNTKGQFNIVKAIPHDLASKIDKDKWRLMRGELGNMLRVLRSEGKAFEVIEAAFIDKVSNELGIYKEEARIFVQGILGQMQNEAGNREIEKKLSDAKEQLHKDKNQIEVAKNEAIKKHTEEVRKRDQQLIKMKRIMDVMKRELDNTKKNLEIAQAKSQLNTADDLKDENAKISEDKMLLAEERRSLELSAKSLETELNLKNKELAKREAQIQSLKDAQQKLLEKNDITVKEYQSRIQEISEAQTHSLTAQEQEELQKLRVENQNLSSIVELSNKKITNLSETYEKLKKHGDDRLAGQLKLLTESKIDLTTQLRQTQDREQKAEARCRTLETSLERLQHEFDKVKLTQAGQASNAAPDQDKMIKELKAEDVAQKQLLKQADINVKKLELKVKLLTEQLAQAQKSAGASAKGGASSDHNKAAEAKVKQLEIALEKANIASSKMKDELADKKKEAIKLKTDLQTVHNQLHEAQRKIGVLEKKKAA